MSHIAARKYMHSFVFSLERDVIYQIARRIGGSVTYKGIRMLSLTRFGSIDASSITLIKLTCHRKARHQARRMIPPLEELFFQA